MPDPREPRRPTERPPSHDDPSAEEAAIAGEPVGAAASTSPEQASSPERARSQSPGTTEAADMQRMPVRTMRGDIWRRFRRNKLAMAGLVVIVLLVLSAVFASVLASHGINEIDVAKRNQSPSAEHWFGTDTLGRDIFSRVVHGARTSLRVGVLAVLIAASIGLVVGAVAGYYGGVIDGLLMRVTDVFLSFPYILAAIAIIVVIGRGENTVIVVLGLLGWMSIARIFRSSIIQVKSLDYVEAARALGANDARIIMRHIVPNAIQPVIVFATLFVGTAVLAEAALSFLAVGVTEPTPAWGLMVAKARSALATHPHQLFFPGAAIFLTVVSFTLVGDGLRDALDPRLR